MLLLFLYIFAFPPVEAGAPAMVGKQVATYWVEPGDHQLRLPSYENNGYRQRVESRSSHIRLEVRISNRQLSSEVPARTVNLPTPLAGLQRALNSQADGLLADQLMVLFQWMRQEINYEWRQASDQEVVRVLANRSANCVGMSNLALYLLEKMGVQARYVTGLAFKPEDPITKVLEGDVLHRWIEVYYEDVGWVFCDPAGKVNFVEATYLVLGVQDVHSLPDMLTAAAGTRVKLLQLNDHLKPVGRFRRVDSRLSIRPNRL